MSAEITPTPGPWRFSHAYKTIVCCENRAAIAWLRESVAEVTANGYVMAAAPELLTALKRLLAEADDDGITRAGVDAAFAAIAKAEGRAE